MSCKVGIALDQSWNSSTWAQDDSGVGFFLGSTLDLAFTPHYSWISPSGSARETWPEDHFLHRRVSE